MSETVRESETDRENEAVRDSESKCITKLLPISKVRQRESEREIYIYRGGDTLPVLV